MRRFQNTLFIGVSNLNSTELWINHGALKWKPGAKNRVWVADFAIDSRTVINGRNSLAIYTRCAREISIWGILIPGFKIPSLVSATKQWGGKIGLTITVDSRSWLETYLRLWFSSFKVLTRAVIRNLKKWD